MENVKIKCGVFSNIAPLYIRPLWCELNNSKKINYSFITSSHGFSGIKTIDPKESRDLVPGAAFNWHFIKNILIRNVLIYQPGLIKRVFKNDYDVYIFLGEMINISTWVAALICKLRKKPVLFWGHGYYGNERYLRKFIRLLFYRIPDYHLVYGNRARNLLIELGFRPDSLITVYNSLDYNFHKRQYESRDHEELEKICSKLFPTREKYPTVLFIGRLTKEKKLSLLLKAIKIQKEKGNEINCLIVGGGEAERKNLEKLVLDLDIKERVYFYGPCYDEILNSKFIMLSQCCVSPGNVGLTAIHSLSLGTPVITHENFYNQGPEVESIIPNRTGFFFKENDTSGLSGCIENIVVNRLKLSMETDCIKEIEDHWNPKNQSEIIEKAVINAYSKHFHQEKELRDHSS